MMAHNRTPSEGGNPYAMSFNSQHSLSHSQPQPMAPQHYPGMNQGQTAQNGSLQPSIQSPYKSFNDTQYSNTMRTTFEKPQIYTAVYSSVQVYEMEVNGVACMRRRTDGWLNATQILKVAGIDKGKRTKVLEKEILNGEHEKVQGGYGKYQGTWINYSRGREFCRQYGVEEALLPLLEYDLHNDGLGAGNHNTETPTKEQAMAANRKRFYNASVDSRNGGQLNQSTFFQNISPMSTMALAAMNKAARLNSPVRPPSGLRRPSMQPGPSHSRLPSENSFPEVAADSAYDSQPYRHQGQEPPRKRMRPSEDSSIAVDASFMSIDATEPNESFLYAAHLDGTNERDDLATEHALPAPSNPEEEEKKALLLDLFADTSRVDYSSHPAFTQLSPQDLSIPLDASANTALHWATTLSRITLLRMLIQKGANIYRGNVAGHSALISAVLVNNCWERSSFPDVLELLSPLIEKRDAQGRTILHHIAVSCGIKGRAPSSKYYLEALLEFLVRSVRVQAADRAGRENSESQDRPKQATLMSFLTNIVNARDKLGNTALNLVARIGNRSIIQQLLEIKADPNIANYKGVSARDFGIGVEDAEPTINQSRPHLLNGTPTGPSTFNNPSNIDPAFEQSPKDAISADTEPDQETAAAQAAKLEDQNQDVISSLTTMLTQNLAQHKSLLSQKAAQIDRLNAEIRELSNMQKTEADAHSALLQRQKARNDRMAKVANLRRSVEERRRKEQSRQHPPRVVAPGEAEMHVPAIAPLVEKIRQLPVGSPDNALDGLKTLFNDPVSEKMLKGLDISDLRALQAAYERNNANFTAASGVLQKRSHQLELTYRKVVSLCTSVPEDKVEESLPFLIAAVESERGGLGFGREEVGRVRDFLVKVEGVREDGVGDHHVDMDTSRLSMGLGGFQQHPSNRGMMGPPELPV